MGIELKTAAAYIRVSTDKQTELSPDSQIKVIQEFAKQNNYIVPSEFIYRDDGISGRSAEKRPSFNSMIAAAKQTPPPFSAILVWKFSRFARNQEEAIAKYNSMNDKLIDMKNKDTALILEKFLKGKEVIKNYEEITIKKNYKKLLGVDQKEIEDDKLEEYNSNIFKMSNSLYEYKNYLKFKFIYDEILEIYKSNEKFNTQCNGIRKQINKLETKLFKTNKRVESLANHKGLILKLFNKSNQNNNKLENINTDANERILELKELYRKYETNKIKSIIVTKLNDSSTIYDALVLVAPFYSFLVETIIKHFEDISQDNIRKTIEEFREFIKYPYITIINNIKISEEKDITIVIKDKYNLCDINVTKGDLDEDNIDNLILSVESICKYNYLRHSKIKLDDVNFVLQAKKILEV